MGMRSYIEKSAFAFNPRLLLPTRGPRLSPTITWFAEVQYSLRIVYVYSTDFYRRDVMFTDVGWILGKACTDHVKPTPWGKRIASLHKHPQFWPFGSSSSTVDHS